MAGAVVEVQAVAPQAARAKASIWAPVVPTGNSATEMAIIPLRTSVNRSRISAVGAAQGHGPGDVGGGIEILAAAVDQVERPPVSGRLLSGVAR